MELQRSIGAAAILVLLGAAACSGGTIGEAVPVDNVYTPPTPAEPSASPSPSPSPSPSKGASSSAGSQAAPQPQPAPNNAVPANSSSKVACPAGTVTARATSYQANEYPMSGSDESQWKIVVSGDVTNGTSRQVRSVVVHVELRTPNAGSSATTTVGTVGQGARAGWTVNMNLVTAQRPSFDDVRVTVRGWQWGDSTLDRTCPRS